MSAIAERQVVVPLKPSPRIEKQMRLCRREDARLAGMLLLAEPERLPDKAIQDFLMEIRFMKREIVDDWIDRAKISKRMPANQLWFEERHLLAQLLARYCKEQGA